jgi:hypothetical protein
MKSSLFSRLVFAVLSLAAVVFVSGCNTPQTPQRSAQAPIPPNWYDSYYYKGGKLVVPNVPDSNPATSGWDR